MGTRPHVTLAVAIAVVIAVVIALACTGPPGVGSSTPGPSSTSTGSAPTDAPTGITTPIPTSRAEAGRGPNGPTESATVVRVIDGDTIVVDRGRGEEKLRYIGIDTPETVKPGSPVEGMGPEGGGGAPAGGETARSRCGRPPPPLRPQPRRRRLRDVGGLPVPSWGRLHDRRRPMRRTRPGGARGPSPSPDAQSPAPPRSSSSSRSPPSRSAS